MVRIFSCSAKLNGVPLASKAVVYRPCYDLEPAVLAKRRARWRAKTARAKARKKGGAK